jgi:hypothetical protein
MPTCAGAIFRPDHNKARRPAAAKRLAINGPVPPPAPKPVAVVTETRPQQSPNPVEDMTATLSYVMPHDLSWMG